MTPIKVKAYGLVNFTKKQYIITQVTVFSIVVILLMLSSVYNFDKYAFGNAKAVILLATLLEIIETFLMLKKFGAKNRSSKH